MDEIKHISVEEFLKLERNSLTLLDLREPDQVLLGGRGGRCQHPLFPRRQGVGEAAKGEACLCVLPGGLFEHGDHGAAAGLGL